LRKKADMSEEFRPETENPGRFTRQLCGGLSLTRIFL